ncbi:hypothetical protein SIN07_05035 [Pediococcus inopinatus]|uniref:hypothetical protein n=1 Tax=Pediococcus TaxID=1253 RepID=UPI00070B9558|nr:hypothetical protein [Pediococcus inopinatus]AVK99887.1 hypothetical protein PI20285_04115 [Pediococcus inopinatus]KRN57087.1 hypothetical protein IV83_GL002077 [Pediococcus inopinatus]WPC18987.1 hypothetical protein N6G95_07010 [Pediococcus inopinatus]WPP08410.1 hypothetical protein SIN07_05035 [Pediococcus inopinatus]
MIAINNDNDWSVPESRMGRLRAKEQQKQQNKVNKRKKVTKDPNGSKAPKSVKPQNKKKNENQKKWFWIVGIIVVIFIAIFFIVRRTNNASAKENAERIVQKSFNDDRDNITDNATRAQMVQLAADAKKIRDNTEANQYSQLASLGKSAISFSEEVANLQSGNNYRVTTTGSKVTSLLEDLKATTFKSDFTGFYNEYHKSLTNLKPKAIEVSKLHKQTNNLFKNGKSGTLSASVTTVKLNNLLDKLNKYPNFERASQDLTRVEKAVKTYRKKQASESSSIASSQASESAAIASSQSASAVIASSQSAAASESARSASAKAASESAASSSTRASSSTSASRASSESSSTSSSSSSKNSSSQSSSSKASSSQRN